jgi:deazaflavin-dependent oxidoreductase (nitroreductase family)
MLRAVLIAGGAISAIYLFLIPVLERIVPHRVLVAYWHFVNPWWAKLARRAPGFGVVETKGRRSGRPHQVPVGGRLDGDTFWFVAGNGRRTDFVRNIEADPQVRVQVGGKWRDGVATICDGDRPRKRLLQINPLNSVFLRIAGRELLTIRVDLDR